MRRILWTVLAVVIAVTAGVIHADTGKLKIVTAYPYIASITEQIAGKNAEVRSLAKAKWDPHFVVPRPSYIAVLRSADLLILNGAELEIGWIPPLVSQANNAKLNGRGTLTLSRYVKLREVPTKLSRTEGDVHPEGNPHFILRPENVLIVAKAIEQRLSEMDPEHEAQYKGNLQSFSVKWRQKMAQWAKQMKALKNTPVIEYHGLFNYLIESFGMKLEGTVERLPGIPPTPKHLVYLEKLIAQKKVRFILQDVYNPDDSSRMLAKKLKVRLIVLPHDVGAVKGTGDIFALFDEIIRRLSHD